MKQKKEKIPCQFCEAKFHTPEKLGNHLQNYCKRWFDKIKSIKQRYENDF